MSSARGPALAATRRSVRDELERTVGFCPTSPLAWLYAARGFYKIHQYEFVIDAVSQCIRNDRTQREAQHLLAFSFFHLGEFGHALTAFSKSVSLGNDTDWQPLVELLLEHPELADPRMTG